MIGVDDLPVYHVSEEDEEYFEQEEQRLDVLLRKKKTKRTQPLKELMRNRNTMGDGLTLSEIFFNVYPDVIKENGLENSNPSLENVLMRLDFIYSTYVKRLIKHLRKTDDDFRHLYPVPCKDDRGKIKQYRYVNIKVGEPGSYGYKLLEETDAFWLRRIEAIKEALQRKRKRLEMLANVTEEQHDKAMKMVKAEREYELSVRDICSKETIDKMIVELRKDGRLQKLPRKYMPDYKRIEKAVNKELLNEQILLRDGWLNSEGKPPAFSEVWQSIKDRHCNVLQ